MNEKNNSLDILGVKSLGDATNTIITKSIGGIELFLKIVCKPAFEEFGLMLGDKVRHWRVNNIINVLEKSQDKLEFRDNKLELKINPRIALGIIENASLTDENELQDLWSGLFAASCNHDEKNDENIIFIDFLKSITCTQAKILKYVCENSIKVIYNNGLMTSEKLILNVDKLKEISGILDLYRLDRELDHLAHLNLIGQDIFNGSGGIKISDFTANVTPTTLALNLYVRCNGYNGDPQFYWTNNIIHKKSSEIKTITVIGSEK